MTTAQCLNACQKLSKKHGFIVTEQAHACLHEDGHRTVTTDRRITVFKGSDIVHRSEDHKTFESAFASVREYLNTLKS